jgi:hypothetical protein
MTISAGLLGSLQISDGATGTSPLVKQLIALVTTGSSYTESNSVSLPASITSITLPISPVTFLYIKNLHAVNTVLVTWTPAGGSTASILTLAPGGFICFGEIAALNGISALSLTASGSATPVEYVLAG